MFNDRAQLVAGMAGSNIRITDRANGSEVMVTFQQGLYSKRLLL